MDEREKSMILRKSILSVVLTIAMLMPLAQAVTVKAADDTKQIDVLSLIHIYKESIYLGKQVLNARINEKELYRTLRTLI